MQRIWDVIVALSLITDKKNALPIELIGKVSAVYCLITSGRNGKKCLLIEKRLSPSVERRTKTKKLTGDNPQNYKEMKLKDIVSQLANRINQPHVIECYLRKVYTKMGEKNPHGMKSVRSRRKVSIYACKLVAGT